jgi:predicted DNA-binding protein
MKTEAYSWRLDPELKGSLEHAARSRGRSVAGLLDEIVRSWLERDGETQDDDQVQKRLHAQARESFGTLQHGDELLAQQARERVLQKLQERHATRRPR